MAKKFRIGIVGAKAYTARELVALLLRHPHVEITTLMGRDKEAVSFEGLYGQFRGRGLPTIVPVDIDALAASCDAVFLTLPHMASAAYTPALLERGLHVIDLSADFRFKNIPVFEATYGLTHAAPELCAQAVYGLPELYRARLPKAPLVACAGCYVTSVLLALAPLIKNDLVEPASLIADSKSGVSGAGRQANETTHFCEANESVKAYKVASHRHAPEIEEHLSWLAGGQPRSITFVPHLMPMDRGIESTCYATLRQPMQLPDIQKLYEDYYRGEPFVRVLGKGECPNTKNVAFTNFCDLGVAVDARQQRVVVMSAIDNLIKGASGQAIQCFNILGGWEETAGLL